VGERQPWIQLRVVWGRGVGSGFLVPAMKLRSCSVNCRSPPGLTMVLAIGAARQRVFNAPGGTGW